MDRRDFSQRNAFGQIILPIIEVGEPLQKFRFLQSLAEQLAKFVSTHFIVVFQDRSKSQYSVFRLRKSICGNYTQKRMAKALVMM